MNEKIYSYISENGLKQGLRFFITGLINTFSGLFVIFLLLFIGINDYVANISGYLLGATISFFLNKYYVFKSGGGSLEELSKFILVFLASYLVNISILYVSLNYINSYASQIVSMVGYSIVNFLLNKFFVFRKGMP